METCCGPNTSLTIRFNLLKNKLEVSIQHKISDDARMACQSKESLYNQWSSTLILSLAKSIFLASQSSLYFILHIFVSSNVMIERNHFYFCLFISPVYTLDSFIGHIVADLSQVPSRAELHGQKRKLIVSDIQWHWNIFS